MFSPCPKPGLRIAMLAFAMTLALCGCERENRQFPEPADGSIDNRAQRQTPLQPSQPYPAKAPPQDYWDKYENNAYAVSQGKRLYRWYNCSGCHAQGGGGMGPALMDDQWIYGGDPARIYATLREGRPNGMPSFAGHISDDQLWQIVAYVRSMSGQLRTDVAPSRSDGLSAHEPEARRERESILQAVPEKPQQ
jgi:cytochrome c oxidase cbb3-type subunit III